MSYPFTYAEMAHEAERELRLRKRIYPNRIATGRLEAGRADRQIELMQAILLILRELAQTERLL